MLGVPATDPSDPSDLPVVPSSTAALDTIRITELFAALTELLAGWEPRRDTHGEQREQLRHELAALTARPAATVTPHDLGSLAASSAALLHAGSVVERLRWRTQLRRLAALVRELNALSGSRRPPSARRR